MSRKVVPGRLELPTSTLSVWRSNQLSYRTGFKLSANSSSAPSFIHSLLYKNRFVSTRSLRVKTLLHYLYLIQRLLAEHLSILSRKEVFS